MTKENNILYTKSLKEQVYEYLREEIHKQNLKPGSMINMDATSRKLGISKTPLRDALIQLEMEGFVTIAPRRGIYVNTLSMEEIREFYQVIGALESSALLTGFDNIKAAEIAKMKKLITAMHQALKKDDFNLFHTNNLAFHDTYINASGNGALAKIVHTLKKRLYDFPSQEHWIKEWEESSMNEHEEILRLIEAGQAREAADHIRNVHWSFEVQEKFIKQYYPEEQ